jgi:hypothetical protein
MVTVSITLRRFNPVEMIQEPEWALEQTEMFVTGKICVFNGNQTAICGPPSPWLSHYIDRATL